MTDDGGFYDIDEDGFTEVDHSVRDAKFALQTWYRHEDTLIKVTGQDQGASPLEGDSAQQGSGFENVDLEDVLWEAEYLWWMECREQAEGCLRHLAEVAYSRWPGLAVSILNDLDRLHSDEGAAVSAGEDGEAATRGNWADLYLLVCRWELDSRPFEAPVDRYGPDWWAWH